MKPSVLACSCLLALAMSLPVPRNGSAAASEPAELTSIMAMKGAVNISPAKSENNLRMKVLRESASTLGFQGGVKWRYRQIMAGVEKRRLEFEKIFNFTPLLIDEKVLPPVIKWAENATNFESETLATSVEAQYRIIAPARIVSTPPSWRDYLWSDFEAIEAVSQEVLPSSSAEKAAWKAAAKEGWDQGVSHADDVFHLNMNKLVSDYRGILRFKMLADRGMVSVPVLSEGRLGVQVGDDLLNVDQRVFRITVPAAFRAAEEWRGSRP